MVAREEGLARLLKQTVGEIGARLQGITAELARVEGAREEGARAVGHLRGRVGEYYTSHMEEVLLFFFLSLLVFLILFLPPPRWPPTPRPWMGRCSSTLRRQTIYSSGIKWRFKIQSPVLMMFFMLDPRESRQLEQARSDLLGLSRQVHLLLRHTGLLQVSLGVIIVTTNTIIHITSIITLLHIFFTKFLLLLVFQQKIMCASLRYVVSNGIS